MSKIIGSELKNIPWEEKPEGYSLPVWRYSGNPIIGRHATKRSNSVFNSAVVPFGDGFAGIFRCDSRSVSMDLFVGFSQDGISWKIQDEPISFEGDPVDHPCESTATIPGYAIWTGSTISPGVTATMVPPLAWAGRRTSRPSTRWKMPSCPITATACSSPGRSTACI